MRGSIRSHLDWVILVSVAALATHAHSDGCVTFHSSPAEWNAVTTAENAPVTFQEAAWPVNTPLGGEWTVNGISFQGFAGQPFPNIYVANFGSPFGTGQWLTANGDENIDMTPASPVSAIAFDAAANPLGPAFITVYDADGTEMGSLTLRIDEVRFVGITSTVPMGRINFSSVLGALQDTGVDTVRTAIFSGASADLNCDGAVDGDDLGTLLGQWGPCAGCPADFNGDGVVDGDDLGTLLGAWGSAP